MAFRWDFWKRSERKYDSLDLMRELYPGWQNWSNKPITLQTALQVTVAFACGRVIAEGFAMQPWKVMKEAGETINPAREHALYDKLAVKPNPLQNAFEFQEQIGMHLAFCGNAYVYTPTAGGRIDALIPLVPGWVTVKQEWPKRPMYEVRVDDGRGMFMLSADEVWHIRGPSWTSYVGLPFMDVARQALGLAMALEEGQSRLQADGVRMPGYLSVEGTLTDEQQTKLRQWIEKDHQGAKNAGRPMILDRAAKWMAAGMSNQDAQLIEQRKFAVEEVCRAMRVLPIMVGHADKTATYASAEQMFLAHAIHTLGPWNRRLELSADARLLTEQDRAQGHYTKLNEKALLRMSSKDQSEMLARLVITGIYTRNEARRKLDENPIEGLDEPLAPANTFAGNPPGPDDDKPAKPAEGDD